MMGIIEKLTCERGGGGATEVLEGKVSQSERTANAKVLNRCDPQKASAAEAEGRMRSERRQKQVHTGPCRLG